LIDLFIITTAHKLHRSN